MSKVPGIILGVDPGLSTGLCLIYTETMLDLPLICRGLDHLMKTLESLPVVPDLIVMEKFKLFKHLALQQSGSKMEVAQAEGIVKSYAFRNNIKVEEQFANILPMAQMFSKRKLNSNHANSHADSAYNHAYYYMVKQGWATAKGL